MCSVTKEKHFSGLKGLFVRGIRSINTLNPRHDVNVDLSQARQLRCPLASLRATPHVHALLAEFIAPAPSMLPQPSICTRG